MKVAPRYGAGVLHAVAGVNDLLTAEFEVGFISTEGAEARTSLINSAEVRIDPVNVLVPLLRSLDRFQEMVNELGRAAISATEPAVRAAGP